jgi:methyl-accepting chemotaxis protein
MTHESGSPHTRRSSPLDVALFLVTFVVGVAIYLTLRIAYGKTVQLPVTLALIFVMLAYAGAVWLVPRLRVRLDQAGDNCYYLGLLFTLISMAFALLDFHVSVQGSTSTSGVQQIISNFGVALATTIVGIFLRVLLHQMRVDPADLEAVTRVELTEAAERLRGGLETATTDLGRFHLEVQQRSSDVVAALLAAVTKTAEDVNRQATESSTRIGKAAEDAFQQVLTRTTTLTDSLDKTAKEAAAAVERLKAVEPPPVTLARRLDKVAATLEQIATQTQLATVALQATVETATKGLETTTKTSQTLDQVAAKIHSEQSSNAERFTQATNKMNEALTLFSGGLATLLSQVTQMQEGVRQSATESERAQKAATEVLGSLVSISRSLADALRTSGTHRDVRA